MAGHTCRELIENLLEYVDGEVDSKMARSMEAHLSECPDCLQFLESYRLTPAVCRRALIQKMPDEVATKLSQFLRTFCKKE